MNDSTIMLQPGEAVALKESVPPHMVQIPLEEYRRYIEATIKGPTVEIALEEYNRLKEENTRLRGDIIQLDFENRELREEINRRTEIKEAVQQEAGKITELLKTVALKVNLVSDSVTRKEKTEESEVVRNGRIRP